MNLGTFLALAIVAMVAGFVYNWITPLITPKLPSQVSGNMILSSIATGVFILVSIAVAHFVARAIVGRKARAVA